MEGWWHRRVKTVVRSGRRNIIRWMWAGRRKIKSWGAGNRKAPHCLSANIWTTVCPHRWKTTLEHTHSSGHIRQTHNIHTSSGPNGLQQKTEKQRIGRWKQQTRGGDTMWSHELWNIRALWEKQQVPYFLTERQNWKTFHFVLFSAPRTVILQFDLLWIQLINKICHAQPLFVLSYGVIAPSIKLG